MSNYQSRFLCSYPSCFDEKEAINHHIAFVSVQNFEVRSGVITEFDNKTNYIEWKYHISAIQIFGHSQKAMTIVFIDRFSIIKAGWIGT